MSGGGGGGALTPHSPHRVSSSIKDVFVSTRTLLKVASKTFKENNNNNNNNNKKTKTKKKTMNSH